MCQSPKKAWQLFLGPLHGCQYLVNQSHHHDFIFNTIYKKYKHQFHPSINRECRGLNGQRALLVDHSMLLSRNQWLAITNEVNFVRL